MRTPIDNLAGKVALITGGAVRIGAAIGCRLAEAGANIVVHYRRSRAAALNLQRKIERLGRRACLVQGGLETEAGCRKIVCEAHRLAGRLDILVNNAAVFHKQPLSAISEKSLLEEFRTNLFAPLILTREFVRLAQRGVVINLLDRRIASLDTSCASYVLTKKALADATKILARSLAPRFRVNAVAPGPVLAPPGEGPTYLRERAGPIPLKIKLAPDDVAKAVLFLALARAVTGQVLFVDGGQGLLGEDAF